MTVENISIDVKTNAGSAAKQIRSLSSALSGISSAAKSIGGNRSGSTAHSIKSVGSAAKSATGTMGKLFASIKRIAMYRLLRTAIKEIAQAFQEGLKNAYNFSKGINGTLAASLDTLATKSLTMKNQLGAAFGSLLETIQPILLRIIALVQQAASAISALFAAFSGGQYLVAKDTAAEWDKATGAAKKYKNTILGFDEINRLNDETGGGGANTVDASNMFEVGEIPQSIQDFVDTVKSLMDHGNFETLGMFVAEKIKGIFNSIDLWSIAETLGTKINNAITTAFGFFKRLDVRGMAANLFAALSHAISQIDFHNLGEVIASKFTLKLDFLLGAFEGIDWEGLGKAVGDLFRGVFDHISDWIDSVDWDKLGSDLFKAIEDFLTGIDFKSLADSFFKALKKAINAALKLSGSFLDAVVEWMNEQDWGQIGEDFYAYLKTTFEGIDFAEIAKSVFTFLGTALAKGVLLLAGFIQGVIDDIAAYFKQFINDENEDGMFSGGEIIKGVFKGILQALKNVGQWIFDNIVKPFIDAFERAFGIASPAKEMESPGENVGLGILAGIVKPFKDIYEWIKTNIFDPFTNAFKKLFGIEGNEESITFKNLGETIVNGLSNGFKGAWDTFVSNVQIWWDGLKNWFNGLSLNLNLRGTTVNDSGFSNSVGKFASGGVHDLSMGSLFVAGEQGAEIVTNMGNGRTGVTNVEQMEAAVANGNTNVVNAVYAMANMIVKAVNEIDPDITLDGQSLADKMYHYNKQAANRYGTAMVT